MATPRTGSVSLGKFANILIVTAALSAYAAWLAAEREREAGRKAGGAPPMVAGIRLYRLPEAKTLWADPSTVFLDVRPWTAFVSGHIAGAVHMPEDEFDQRLPTLRSRLEAARTVVVYCGSARCARALRVVMRLRTEGLAHTHLYPTGWNEWYLQGLPIERTAAR